jgi:hypothetical protein
MTTDLLLRTLALCVVLACSETLHGIARTVLVVPRIGKQRAIQLSALTGSLVAWMGNAKSAPARPGSPPN